MADYISREAAINLICENIEARREWASDARGEIQGLNVAMCCIEDVPAADVRPVVRGKWNVVEKPLEKATICECSECKHRIWMYDGDDGWNYCPHCGADMREVTP